MKYPRITIHGQPPSKSNRKGITKTGHYYKPNTVKLYEDAFFLQCPLRGTTSNPLIKTPFAIHADVFFRSNAVDLDNSLKVLLDILQSKCHVIRNDNLCAEIHVRKFVDKSDPRIEFELEEIY